MHVGQNRLKRKVPTRVKQGALPFSVSPNSITQSALGGYGKKSKIVWSRTCALGQFHVTTDTTQKNKSSYSEYLVIVLYSTHITCHGFKGNIQI